MEWCSWTFTVLRWNVSPLHDWALFPLYSMCENGSNSDYLENGHKTLSHITSSPTQKRAAQFPYERCSQCGQSSRKLFGGSKPAMEKSHIHVDLQAYAATLVTAQLRDFLRSSVEPGEYLQLRHNLRQTGVCWWFNHGLVLQSLDLQRNQCYSDTLPPPHIDGFSECALGCLWEPITNDIHT